MPSASKVEKRVPRAPPTNSPSSPAVASQKPIEHPWVSAQPLEEGCAQGWFPFDAQRGQWRVWLWLLLAFVQVLPWASNPSHTHTRRPKHSKTNSVTQRPNTLDPGHIHTHPCLQMCASTNSGLETGMRKDTDTHRDRMPRITADMPQTFTGIDSAAVKNCSLSAVTLCSMQTGTQGHRGTVTKHAFTQTHTTFAHAQLWIHSGSTQLTSMPTQPPLETVLPLKFKSSLSPSTLWPCCRPQHPCCQPN